MIFTIIGCATCVDATGTQGPSIFISDDMRARIACIEVPIAAWSCYQSMERMIVVFPPEAGKKDLFLIGFVVAIFIGIPIVSEFFRTGLVARLPTAVIATGLMVIAFLSLACGLILDTVTRGRWEAKRMAYLAITGPQDLLRSVQGSASSI